MIKIVNGYKTFSNGEKKTIALNRVNIEINTSEIAAIVGPSGSGKSTLLNIIAGYDFLDKGSYFINDELINDININDLHKNTIGVIFQDYQLFDYLNVKDNILMGCVYGKKKIDKTLFKEIVNDLGLKSLLDKSINVLSGGEKQRVAIARLLLANKSIILADEPTGALDELNAKLIIDIFKRLASQGKTIIIVTHSIDLASKCDRIIHLENGYAS